MSKRLISKIEEFKRILYSQPPHGEYFEGDMVEWVKNALKEEELSERKILKENFIMICLNYVQNNKDSDTFNIIKAQKVYDFIINKEVSIEINQDNCTHAQIITLFRILQKELNVFNNTDKDIKEVLKQTFGISESNINKYFERDKDGNKLFKCEWRTMYDKKKAKIVRNK